MRHGIAALVLAVLAAACASSGHQSHRKPLDNGKIDYPYWETYLLQHGEAETLAHFEALVADTPADEQGTLVASFERFCRFLGCLAGYRSSKGEGPN